MRSPFTKFLCGVTAGVMLFGEIPNIMVSAAEETVFGDYNGDGKINETDLTEIGALLQENVATVLAGDECEEAVARVDVNHDYVVDAADYRWVQEYVEGNVKAFPKDHCTISEDNITLAFSKASCFAGESTQVELSIVDWKKDIFAYDMVVRLPAGFTLEEIHPAEGTECVKLQNAVKLYGSFAQPDAQRGKIASFVLKADAKTSGDCEIACDTINVYTSDNHFYSSETALSNIHVSELVAPVSLTASGISSKSVLLNWVSPFTQNPIIGFKLFRNDVEIGVTNELYYLDTGLTADTEYVYTVCAVDAEGNTTDKAIPLTVKTAAPVIRSVAFPSVVIGGDRNEIVTELEQKMLLSEMNVAFYSGDTLKYSEKIPLQDASLSTVAHHLDLSKLTDGEYTVLVTVTDADGVSAEKKTTVSVKTKGAAAVELVGYAGGGFAKLTWTLAEEADVVGYQVFRKAADEKEFTCVAKVSGRDTLDYTDSHLSADAEYSYYVVAVDEIGMLGAQSNIEKIVPTSDVGIPRITYFYPESANRISGECVFSIEAADDNSVSRVDCLISDEAGEKWEELFTQDGDKGVWYLNTKDYKDGVYQFKAMAYDDAGNASNGTNVVSMMIDNTPPETVKNVHLTALYATQATVAWDDVADEDIASFSVLLTTGSTTKSYSVKNLGINLSSLVAKSTYIISVAAIDLAGNISEYSQPLKFITTTDTTPPVVTYFRCGSASVANGVRLYVSVNGKDDSSVARYQLEYSQDEKEWRSKGYYSDTGFYVTFSDLVDGPLYLRARGIDIYDNRTKDEDCPVLTLTADCTPPDAVTVFYAQQKSSKVILNWEAPEGDVIGGYTLQRAVGEDGNFVTVFSNTNYSQYTDSKVETEQTYRYRIAALDAAGNQSKFSEPISIVVEPDSEPPVITQVYLSSEGVVCEAHHKIQILAEDEVYLDHLTVEYAVDDSDEWTVLNVADGVWNTSHKSGRFEVLLPESVYTAESVTLRTVAVDGAENATEARLDVFPVDNTFTVIEDAAAVCEENHVQVSFNCPDVTNTLYFYVNRIVNNGEEYRLTSIKPVAGQTAYTATDTRITESGSYVYRIIAVRSNGNTTTVDCKAITVASLPKAVLQCDVAQKLGAEYYFDATGCTAAAEINSVVLEYGDGTSDTATSVTAAKFKHKYEKAGSYTAILTCTNQSGFSDSVSVQISVEEESKLAALTVSVKTTDGNAASYASVYLDVGSAAQMEYETDANGLVTIWTTAGTHEIGVLGSNYLPETRTCTVYAGAKNIEEFSVVENELVSASFEITRMTLSEIKAAGIPVADPANSQVVRIEVQLAYQDPDCDDVITIIYDEKSGISLIPEEFRKLGYQIYTVHQPNKTDVDTVVLMRIPTEVHMLKEMFKVDMIIMNNAATQYTLEDCMVSLNVPQGLTLMESAQGSSKQVTTISDIPGQQSRKVSWILRGDVAGDFPISADFYGRLSVFNEEIFRTFEADSSIHVNGMNAMDITLNVDSTIVNDRMLLEFCIKNVSNVPIYNVSADVGPIFSWMIGKGWNFNVNDIVVAQNRMIGTDNILRIMEGTPTNEIETLNPGETFSVLYLLKDFSYIYTFDYLYAMMDTLDFAYTNGAKVKVNVKPLALADEDSLFYGIAFDKETQYMFAFQNKKGKALSGVEFSMRRRGEANGEYFTGVSDEKGRVIVPRTSDETEYIVTAKLEGFRDYNDYDFHFPRSTNSTHQIVKMSAETNGLDLEPVCASLYEDGKYKDNVLVRSYSFFENDPYKYKLIVSGAEDVTEYQLMSGTHCMAKATVQNGFGRFEEIPASRFTPGEKLTLRCCTETGDYITETLLITVEEDRTEFIEEKGEEAMNEVVSHLNCEVTVPANVMFVGGKKINFTFPAIFSNSAVVTVSGNKFSVLLNAKRVRKDDPDPPAEDEVLPPFNLEPFIMEGEEPTYGIPKETKDTWNYKKVVEWKFGDGILAISLGAYFEGTMDMKTGELGFLGRIFVAATASGNIVSGQIGTYPFYGSIGFSVSASLNFQVAYSTIKGWEDSGVYFDLYTTLPLEIMAGYKGIGGIGVYGLPKMDISFWLLPKLGLKTVEFSAVCGIQAEFFDFKAKFPIFEFTKKFYPPEKKTLDEAMELGMTAEEYKKLYKEQTGNDYDEDREKELQQQGRPRGIMIPMSAFFRPRSASDLTEPSVWSGKLGDENKMSVLLKNADAGMVPVLCSDGKNVILMWSENDISRGEGNAAHLVYSVYDAQNRTWSAPHNVDDNNNADYYPTLYAAADGIHVAYLESKAVFEDANTMDLNAYAMQMQAATMTFDAAAGRFTQYQALDIEAPDTFAEDLQFMESQDGTLNLVWRSRKGNDYFDMDYTECIRSAKITENGITAATDSIAVENMLNVAYVQTADGKPAILYTKNPDGAPEDLSGAQLVLHPMDGEETVLATGLISALSYTALSKDGKKSIVWVQDGKLYTLAEDNTPVELFNLRKYGGNGNYCIVNGQILFLGTCEEKSVLYSCQYDAETKTVSAPIILSQAADETNYAMMLAADCGGETMISAMQVAAEGEYESYDVCCGTFCEHDDLMLSCVSFDSALAVTDGELPISFWVTNAGTQTVDAFTVSLLDETGEVLASEKMEADLDSGYCDSYLFNAKLGTVEGPVSYTLKVETEQTDATPENNTAAVNLTKTDIAIETEMLYLGEDKTQVTLILTNNSNVATNALIEVKPQQADAPTITMLTEDIAPYTSAIYTLDGAMMLGNIYHDFVDVKVSTKVEDRNLLNNTTSIVLTNGGFYARQIGDMNFDGKIDVVDAIHALKLYASEISEMENNYTGVQHDVADVDRNETVDTTDAVLILQYYSYSLLLDDDDEMPTFEQFLESQLKEVTPNA